MSINASFTVSLNQASTSDTTMDYATRDGTAVAGTDYRAVSGSLTVPAGSLQVALNVPILDTVSPAKDINFYVDLTNANGGEFTKSTGMCTISGGSSADTYLNRFKSHYALMMNKDSGYFGPTTGAKAYTVPYHMLESIIVEAPDWGQESVSETASFFSKMAAWNGILTGDTSDYIKSWSCIEDSFIPSATAQPWGAYTPASPAQVIPDALTLESTPVAADSTMSAGTDPLYSTLKSTYGTSALYLMHWLIDVDGIYGFHGADGSKQCVPINNYQRGPVEDGWATITHASYEDFTNGGTAASGFLAIYGQALPNYPNSSGAYSKQWDYSVAPDAESRTIIASYLISQTLGSTGLTTYDAKAKKMADFQRYAFYDKYFRPIGTYAGDGCHYLLSWGCGFGGAIPDAQGNSEWGFRIGNSEIHQGYNCVDVAYVCGTKSGKGYTPLSTGAADMYDISLDRQLEFLRWLQTSDGAFAGGCTSNWNGDYSVPTDGRQNATFYGLYYTYSPSWHNPPSNNWAGYQGWAAERIARLYNMVAGSATTNDTSVAVRCKTLLDRWMLWLYNNTTVSSTEISMPGTLDWTSPTAIAGKTATAPNAEGTYEYLPTLKWDSTGDYSTFWDASTVPNPNLQCTVTKGVDVGFAGAAAEAIIQYCKGIQTATGALTGVVPGGSILYQDLLDLACKLLDCLWHNYKDTKGFGATESFDGYTRLNDTLWIPPEFGTGAMPDGSVLANGKTTFLSMRSFYKNAPEWSAINNYVINGGTAPTVVRHRFWQNAEIATALAMMAYYFPNQAAS